MSRILVITTSLRAKSNSDILAERLIAGAREAGHDVTQISLRGKEIRFCVGCRSCKKTGKCAIRDDAVEIAEKVKNADTLVFSTPIYYYEMSGQMKTLLDAAEDVDFVPQKAVSGLQGWIACFKKAELGGTLFCGGISDPGEASGRTEELNEAYEFGKALE